MLIPLESIGFKIIKEDIKELKREYFKDYRGNVFIEMQLDNFI